jgi:hypothetical protein
LDEPPPLVGERHGNAVDLRFARERQGREIELGDEPDQPLGPAAQLGFGLRVVEAHHRDLVPDLREQGRRGGANPEARRVGRDQFRVIGLDRPQLAHQRVVLGVGDLGAVEHVVPLVVMIDERAQLGRPLRRRPLGHQRAMPAPRTRSGSVAS